MQTKRNIGIDLLKIVSMLMIVTLHMLGHGGVLDNMPPMSRCYQVAWLIEIACYGAVNCYALASGFLTARCNIRKLMELWLQVMFYSLLITIVMECTVLHGTISREEWIYSFFPVTSGKNWYVTAYFGMMCLIPMIRLRWTILIREYISTCWLEYLQYTVFYRLWSVICCRAHTIRILLM